MTEHKNIGSSFASFLVEEGLAEDVSEHAIKAVLAWQLEQEMVRQGLTKKDMAALVGTSRSQLDRVLDPTSDSVQLATLKKVAAALGKRVRIELVDAS